MKKIKIHIFTSCYTFKGVDFRKNNKKNSIVILTRQKTRLKDRVESRLQCFSLMGGALT